MVGLNTKLDPTQTGHDAEKLYTDLHKRIIGQDEAIDQIVNVYQMYLVGMNSPSRPIGNLLFLGPTGSGKTCLAEAMAESLVGDARPSIDEQFRNEFQHKPRHRQPLEWSFDRFGSQPIGPSTSLRSQQGGEQYLGKRPRSVEEKRPKFCHGLNSTG